MKKMLVILIAGLLVLFAGCDFLEGPAGADGNSVPGGTIEITISEGLTTDSKIVLVFDPDAYLLDGDETVYEFSLSDYILNGSATLYTTWYAPEVGPGSYYVYYWIDFDGDGQIATFADDGGMEEGNLKIFGSSAGLVFDPPGAVAYIKTIGSSLFPNYTVWEDYAPQLNLGIEFTGF